MLRLQGLTVGVSLAAMSTALGQTVALPEITVNAPSPIRRDAPGVLAPGSLVVVPDAFAPVTVVTGDEIARDPGRTLGDLLATRPGISSSSFAPGAASRPVIRGLDNYRVRIQENGIGSHDVSEIGEDHGVPVDPLAAQQIEVLRGPATLRWGSQAIGGVVSVTNNRIPDRVPNRVFNMEAKGALSSVDRGFESGVLVDIGKDRFAIHADAFVRGAGDYRIPSYPYLNLEPDHPAPAVNGRQPNSSARADGQSVGGSYFFDGGYIGAAISQYRSFYRVPGLEASEENARIDLRQTKLSTQGEFRPQSAAIDVVRFWLGTTDYKHDEIATEDGVDGVHQTFTNKEWEGRVEVQLAPVRMGWATWQAALGVQAGHQRLTAASDEGGLFDPNRTRTAAAFLFNEFDFGNGTRAQLAGRIEHVGIKGTVPDLLAGGDIPVGRDLGFAPKSISAGLLQDLPLGLVASLTGQYVERAPRAPELLSRGEHHATETFDIGNPNLGIEAARTVEIGLKKAKGPLRFDASAYHSEYRGFIYRRLTGATCSGGIETCEMPGAHDDHDHDHDHDEAHGHALRQAIYTQRNARFTGAEIAAQLDIAPLGNGLFGIDAQYDIVRARFDDGSAVPRLPPQRFGGGLWWRSAEWFARVGVLHATAQTRVADNETPTDAYTLVKAELSHTRKLAGDASTGGIREVTVGVVGNNLLDADVRNHVSFRKDDVLQPGRNVRLFASVKF